MEVLSFSIYPGKTALPGKLLNDRTCPEGQNAALPLLLLLLLPLSRAPTCAQLYGSGVFARRGGSSRR